MALGRGLSELLGEVETAYDNNTDNKNVIKDISVNEIKANPYQPRKIFDETKLNELSESIQRQGLLQPIVITKTNNEYILVSGERRLRASKLANLKTIKAIILSIEEKKLREYALIENIQRDDLNILEIAYSYAGLINEFNITHEELSKIVFKSRSVITNTLRLLTLSVYTQKMISMSKISLGHAKLLTGFNDEEQKKIVDSIIGQRLSVRETEKLIIELKSLNTVTPESTNKKGETLNFKSLDSVVKKLENNDLKIKISNNTMKISFNSQEEIEKFTQYFSSK